MLDPTACIDGDVSTCTNRCMLADIGEQDQDKVRRLLRGGLRGYVLGALIDEDGNPRIFMELSNTLKAAKQLWSIYHRDQTWCIRTRPSHGILLTASFDALDYQTTAQS
jgi:hypothetical protein